MSRESCSGFENTWQAYLLNSKLHMKNPSNSDPRRQESLLCSPSLLAQATSRDIDSVWIRLVPFKKHFCAWEAKSFIVVRVNICSYEALGVDFDHLPQPCPRKVTFKLLLFFSPCKLCHSGFWRGLKIKYGANIRPEGGTAVSRAGGRCCGWGWAGRILFQWGPC